jgi:hypothetical protein
MKLQEYKTLRAQVIPAMRRALQALEQAHDAVGFGQALVRVGYNPFYAGWLFQPGAYRPTPEIAAIATDYERFTQPFLPIRERMATAERLRDTLPIVWNALIPHALELRRQAAAKAEYFRQHPPDPNAPTVCYG